MLYRRQSRIEVSERDNRRSFAGVNPLGTLAGIAIGVTTRLAIGRESAYRSPGGALGAGLMFTLIPRNLKARAGDYIVNIVNCEVGYYAGVMLTDMALGAVGMNQVS